MIEYEHDISIYREAADIDIEERGSLGWQMVAIQGKVTYYSRRIEDKRMWQKYICLQINRCERLRLEVNQIAELLFKEKNVPERNSRMSILYRRSIKLMSLKKMWEDKLKSL